MLAAEAATAKLEQHLLTSLMPRVDAREHIAVAVSGGSDSMALLRMCGALSARFKFDLTALTVDHGLRPGSADEAMRVAAWCAAAAINHVTLAWVGPKPKTGIQEAARHARYDLLTAWCRQTGVNTVLTAHTLDDQAETVVMRGNRSNSPRSIAGIWPEMDWNGVAVVRPLLGITRDTLRAYLQSIGQSWIDDPSNDNLAFERIRVRRALDARRREGLGERAAAAWAEVTELAGKSEKWLAQFAEQHPLGFLMLERPSLAELPLDLCTEILRDVIGQVSHEHEVPLSEIERLGRWLLQRGQSSQPRRTLAGCLFARRKNVVLVAREWARIKSPDIVPDTGHLLWDGRFAIAAPAGSRIEAAGNLGHLQRPAGVPSYIFAGLPAVTVGGYPPVLPQFAPISASIPFVTCETIGFPGRLRRLTSWNPAGGNLC